MSDRASTQIDLSLVADPGTPEQRDRAQNRIIDTVERVEAELAAAVRRVSELEAWAQQVTDALDGRPLPEHPDATPARIAAAREREATLRAEVDAVRHVLRRVLEWPLPQGSVESYSLPSWLAREARLALEAAEESA